MREGCGGGAEDQGSGEAPRRMQLAVVWDRSRLEGSRLLCSFAAMAVRR
jgi:hypothetical protein